MSYLLDTNVLSEFERPRPSPVVLDWLKALPSTSLYVSVLSLGEIRRGLELMPHGPRRERIRVWLERDLPTWFQGRLLPIDAATADRWGRMQAESGQPRPAVDGLIAATALQHGLHVVTRDVEDFRYPGLEVVNPWQTA